MTTLVTHGAEALTHAAVVLETMRPEVSALTEASLLTLTATLRKTIAALAADVAASVLQEACTRSAPQEPLEVVATAFEGLPPIEAAALASRLSVAMNAAVLVSLASNAVPPPAALVGPSVAPVVAPTVASRSPLPVPRTVTKAVVPERRRQATNDDHERVWMDVKAGKSWSEVFALGLCSRNTLSAMQKVRDHLGPEAAGPLPWSEAKAYRTAFSEPDESYELTVSADDHSLPALDHDDGEAT